MAFFWPHKSISKEQLNILSWSGYTDRDVVKIFEQKHLIDVNITYVNNDQQLRQYIESSDSEFDLVALNTSELQRYISLKAIRPLDIKKITNIKWLANRFTPIEDYPEIAVNKLTYGIPFTYSSMGIIYHKERVSSPPTSWAEFWSPENKHKILGYDGGTHNVSLAALYLQMPNPFSIPSDKEPVVANQLIKFRENAFTFYSSIEEATKLFNDYELSMMFANFGYQQLNSLLNTGADVDYVIPEEGALAWLDCWAIPVSSRQSELAYKWLNFSLEPWVQKLMVDRHGLQSPLLQFSPKTVHQGLIWLAPVENPEKREAMWNAIYSGRSLPGVIKHLESY